MSVNIGIIAPNHGRQKILKIFCAGIERLREETKTHIPCVVVSGFEDLNITSQYRIKHLTMQNKPVSDKLNAGVLHMRDIGVDYVMIMGSDNIMSTQTFLAIREKCEMGYDLVGVNTMYFYSTDGIYKGELSRLDTPLMLGVAKTISKKVLNYVGWMPWNVEKSWGLDAIASKNIAPYSKSQFVISNSTVVDLKSRENLNKYSLFQNRRLPKYDPKVFFGFCGKEEKQLISEL